MLQKKRGELAHSKMQAASSRIWTILSSAQSTGGAVEYTDCISAEE